MEPEAIVGAAVVDGVKIVVGGSIGAKFVALKSDTK
jgi:hypothetical protein